MNSKEYSLEEFKEQFHKNQLVTDVLENKNQETA